MNQPKTEIDVGRFKQIAEEIEAYIKAERNNDEPTSSVMRAHIDSLLDERARVLGLSEEEITKIKKRGRGLRFSRMPGNGTISSSRLVTPIRLNVVAAKHTLVSTRVVGRA
jgi:transposase